MRPKSNLLKKILSLSSSTIVDVRALLRVDCSRLDPVAQLHRKDATMSIRHWMLWIRGWVGLNIPDMVRDPIRNLVRANGGFGLLRIGAISQIRWASWIRDQVLGAPWLENHWTRVVHSSVDPSPITIRWGDEPVGETAPPTRNH